MQHFFSLPLRSWLLGAALCAAVPLTGQAQGSTTFSKRVAASSDDAEEDKATGAHDLTSSDLELTQDGSKNQWIGMRFTNVTIPQGAVVTNAYLQFTVDEAQPDPTSVTIYGQNADNTATFAAVNNDVSSRPRTTTTVAWNNIPAWTTLGDAGLDQRTPDIKTIVQQLLNRPGWVSGNAMTFLIDGTGHRTARSYDFSGTGPVNAPQLVIQYASNMAPIGLFPIAQNSVWRYNDMGTDLGATAWKTAAFNDASWAFGPGVLGFGDPVATTVSGGPTPSNVHPTTYFRYLFDVADASLFNQLNWQVRRDDGVVVYLNGTEVFRQNMPAGPVTHATLASTPVDGADEVTYFPETTPATALLTGRNVLAVEVHQSAANSPDLGFDLAVTGSRVTPVGPLPDAAYPLLRNSPWSYYYEATGAPAGAWNTLAYNADAWFTGNGSLGYGNAPTTPFGFGSNSAAKPITAYFRRVVTIPSLAALADTVQLGLLRDDGAVVYVNGVEAVRTNLPTGAITAATLATLDVQGSNETAYTYYKIAKNKLVAGRNILAVEVHQVTAASDDLGFDLELKDLDPALPTARMGCNGPNDTHFGCFTSVEPAQQTGGLVLPATHTFQVLAREGQAYTNSTGNMPGNNDFTGYVARGGSSALGYLSINHENNPGGVSILDLRFNPTTKLWAVEASQAVNFTNNDLVRTASNCSGGITPRGTVLTCEETKPVGDSNNDGYDDLGWVVEIDPATRNVKTYGSAKQEKLWAMGRMSHENAAPAADDRTVYEGEDSSTGHVYKFVATTAGNLSAGTLYALKLDQPLNAGDPTGTTGTWVVVPNTTQVERNTTVALADALGATPFNGVEDVEISPVGGKISFTAKGVGRTYRFTDNGTTVSNFETLAGGRAYNINFGRGIAPEDWASGNDNLVFDDRGNDYVQQDGSRNHLWMLRPGHTQATPQVELFARTPIGSESTGMTFTPDYKFAFLSFQHPNAGANATTVQIDAAGTPVSITNSTTIVVARREFLGTGVISATAGATAPTATLQVYPNPSSGQRFTVGFRTARPANVDIALYDLNGRRLRTLAHGHHERGDFNYAFDATRQVGHALHGLFVLRLTIDGHVETRKIVID